MSNTIWLKEQMWSEHENFEKNSFFIKKLRDDKLTKQDYADFFMALEQIVVEVEKYAKHFFDIDFEFSKDIKYELLLLNCEEKKLNILYKLNSKNELLGSLYALHGSMKGGSYIKNILSKNPIFFNHNFIYYRQRIQTQNLIEDIINTTVFDDAQKQELLNGVVNIFKALNYKE